MLFEILAAGWVKIQHALDAGFRLVSLTKEKIEVFP